MGLRPGHQVSQLCPTFTRLSLLTTFRAHPCSHVVCSACVGVSCLISINQYCCPFCWVVPTHITVSWSHQDGEQRLYLEGPEVTNKVAIVHILNPLLQVVRHRGLAAHFESRFRDFWLTNPPRLRKDQYDDYTRRWIEEKMPKYGIVGGLGVSPSTGIIANTQRRVSEEDHYWMHPRDQSDNNPGI